MVTFINLLRSSQLLLNNRLLNKKFSSTNRNPTPHQQISLSNFYLPPLNTKFHKSTQKNLHFDLFSCCHCCCTTFILFLYSFYTKVMLILISINAQSLKNFLFRFDKVLNSQNQSLLHSYNPIKCCLYWQLSSLGRIPTYP